jgi:2-dehydro-3-deoxyglucarate aldolase
MTTGFKPFPNTFKQKLLAGQPLYGCWSSLASHISTEVIGVAGFDWILLDGEHAPNEMHTLVAQSMALKNSVSAQVVRPSWNDTVEIKRLLDSGFFNFLIPFVESTDEAIQAVAATRYPPEGVRGVSVSTRSNGFGSVPDYFKQINKEICVMVQIESLKGVEAARDIAAIDGVDSLFVGPADLAAAVGHLGNPGHPEVQKVIAEVFAAAKANGKPSGILAPVEADARRYAEMGATFIGVASDLGLLRGASQAVRDKFLG